VAEVALKELCKKYGEVEAVKKLDLQVNDREFFCFLGPSGCGKTSTLRMIAGLEKITAGEIRIGGRLVNNIAPGDRNVAMVFETYALYPHMTVSDNISFPLRIRGMPKEDVGRRVGRAADILQIPELLDRYPRQLSGGQRQRVAIGRAIVREPAVFLMDEPISHLDAKLRSHMRGELKRLQKDLATTTVYVTHDQLEAMSMADRIAVLNFGVLQQLGTPDEIFNHPANLFVAGFIGDPTMNFVECTARLEAGELRLQAETFAVEIPPGGVRAEIERLAAEDGFVFGIRPNSLAVSHQKTAREHIEARVYISEPVGEWQTLSVELGKQIIKAIVSDNFKSTIGETVWLGFDLPNMHIFDKKSGKAIA
jgi:multiple sugar transport system ATP-binding protein